ncbi:MAG: cyclomaltodextrinase N-terminal domain-containing protein, partial [Bacteroidales bacterium]|nr:cyclomaltodextrinase N-terminal domain-containing protein [Bacteroidales bacterium]
MLCLAGNTLGQRHANKLQIWPQEWWTGMKYNKVLLLINGNNISTANASLNHPGVRIINQYGADNKAFLFVEIEITQEASAGIFPIRIARGNTPVGSINFTLNARQYNYTPSPITGADAIYQIVPDRFVNGYPANDNVSGIFEQADRSNPSGVHGGDAAGLSKAVGYLKDLGITAIELTPLYESNQLILSYDKFSPTSHFSPDLRIGSPDEIKSTIQQYRNSGIKVILTLVLHNAGNQHFLMQNLPDLDWVFKRDLLAIDKPNTVVFADPYAAAEDINRHAKIWESFDMPAFNHQNKALNRYLIQHAIWWVESFQPDGIKIDKTHFNHPEHLSQLTQTLLEDYPQLNVIAAPNTKNEAVNAFWQTAGANDFQFSHLSDGPLKEAASDAFAAYSATQEALMPIYQALAADHIYNDAINQLIYSIDDHTSTRLFTLAEKDLAIYKLYMGFLLTTRGIPSFLYGSELLMDGYIIEGQGFVRGDFPGGWAGDKVSAFNQATLSPAQREAWQFTSTLLNWRKHNPDVFEGSMIQLEPFEDVYAYI